MNPVQYIIINKSLNMSTGKVAAQAVHAGQQGLLTHVANDTTKSPYNSSIVNRWMMGGHKAVVVLEADDLVVAERYINDRGFKTALIIDEGRTEIEPMTPTAIGTGIVDKDQGHVRATFGEFALYSDSAPSKPDVLGKTWDFDQDGRIFDLDDSDPTGDLEGPGRMPPGDWLTEGARRNAALPPGFVNKDEVLRRRRIKEMFRRVRERLGEADLDDLPIDPDDDLPIDPDDPTPSQPEPDLRFEDYGYP